MVEHLPSVCKALGSVLSTINEQATTKSIDKYLNKFISHSSGDWVVQDQGVVDSVSCEACFLDHRWESSHCPLVACGGKKQSSLWGL
jgi:hypothetical protein